MKKNQETVENDVLDLGIDLDVEMEDEEEFDRQTTTSYTSLGLTKDPELSVNNRLRPENMVDRPFGMPPLLSRDAQKQLQELDEMKAENRLHELSNFKGSRSGLNRSMYNYGIPRASSRAQSRANSNAPHFRKPNNQAFVRNYRNDAIGNRSDKGGKGTGRNPDLRQMLVKTLDRVKDGNSSSFEQMDEKTKTFKGSVGALLQDQTIAEYVTVINKNFGPKYDVTIQKEIANLQKKPFLYACGTARTITEDGSGVGDQKMKVIGSKSSINCRFSHL